MTPAQWYWFHVSLVGLGLWLASALGLFLIFLSGYVVGETREFFERRAREREALGSYHEWKRRQLELARAPGNQPETGLNQGSVSLAHER